LFNLLLLLRPRLADRQEMVVTQWRDRSLMRTEGQRIATTVIRGFLNDSTDKENPINLDELSAAIHAAIVSR
jgi:hypothetical protein